MAAGAGDCAAPLVPAHQGWVDKLALFRGSWSPSCKKFQMWKTSNVLQRADSALTACAAHSHPSLSTLALHRRCCSPAHVGGSSGSIASPGMAGAPRSVPLYPAAKVRTRSKGEANWVAKNSKAHRASGVALSARQQRENPSALATGCLGLRTAPAGAPAHFRKTYHLVKIHGFHEVFTNIVNH